MLLVTLIFFSTNVLSAEFNTTPQAIETVNIPKGYKKVSFNKKYTVAIPKSWNIELLDFDDQLYAVRDEKGNATIMLDEIHATNKVFFNPERYGLNHYTRRQLITALFDQTHLSNIEVNESRKLIFKRLKNASVYNRAGFLFFREDMKVDDKIKSTITVSSPKNDEILSISFFIKDQELIMNFIQSFNFE